MFEDENVELSPLEAMEVLNWKRSKVYYWINSGKFKTVQRIDGDKILLTQADINRLRVKADFESVQNNSENSENVQENSVQNITKDYKEVQKSLNSETFEFFNKSLETIKQIHQASLQNYGYSLKLLTDGQTANEKEILELKQEKKTVEESLKKSEKEFQESLKKFEKTNRIKNIVIIVLGVILFLFIAGFITYHIAKSDTVSDTVVEKSVQVEPKSDQVKQPKQQPKPIPKVVKRK